jgi:sugar (pentulose or hexulose) kinase
MQLAADVTGVPITLTEVGEAAVLGCAILAAAGAGLHDGVEPAAAAMVHETDTIEPDAATHEAYADFVDAYADTWPRMRELVHAMTRKVGRDGSPG